MWNRLAILAAASLGVAACSDPPPLMPRAGLTVVDGGVLPAPSRTDLTLSQRPYVLGAGDRISVEVFGMPELARQVQLDASGQFGLPIAGTINASGKTPSEIGRIVEDALRNSYLRNPQVAVNLVEGVSQIVTVEGEVKEPGTFPVIGQTTLVRTIARAKGLTDTAKAEHVVVLRRVGGQDMAALYDLQAIRRGYYADPDIYANDVVVVSESRARRMFGYILQASGLITTPIIALVQHI